MGRGISTGYSSCVVLLLPESETTVASLASIRHGSGHGPTRLRSIISVGLTAAVISTVTISASTTLSASAQESAPTDVAGLALQLTDALNDISGIEAEIGGLQESVNKAFVDLQDARTIAEAARQKAAEAGANLDSATAALDAAQAALDELSRTMYRQGATPSVTGVVGADATKDALDRASFLRGRTAEQSATLADLDAQRIEIANEESQLRAAQAEAESREAAAEQKEAEARAAVASATESLAAKQAERDALAGQVATLQSQMAAARGETATASAPAPVPAPATGDVLPTELPVGVGGPTPLPIPVTGYAGETATADASGSSSGGEEEVDYLALAETALNTATAIVDSGLLEEETYSDPLAVADAVINDVLPAITGEAAVTGTGTTGDSQFGTADDFGLSTLQELSNLAQAAVPGSRQGKIEAVINRAMGVMGTPYVWGGGNAQGPTGGGFDCSGLVMYAFAAAGISLPHYSGYQYQRGTAIPIDEIQRGDLLFWGPGGSQHVAIYLGGGQMIEAPYTGSTVKISEVRYAGMSDHAVRLI